MEQPGKNAAGLQATLALLKRFTRHRLSYELSDLFDHYLAFMFVPTLALMALVLLGEVGLFNGVIPAAPIEAFFILAVLTLLLWLYLCGSDRERCWTGGRTSSRTPSTTRIYGGTTWKLWRGAS